MGDSAHVKGESSPRVAPPQQKRSTFPQESKNVSPGQGSLHTHSSSGRYGNGDRGRSWSPTRPARHDVTSSYSKSPSRSPSRSPLRQAVDTRRSRHAGGWSRRDFEGVYSNAGDDPSWQGRRGHGRHYRRSRSRSSSPGRYYDREVDYGRSYRDGPRRASDDTVDYSRSRARAGQRRPRSVSDSESPPRSYRRTSERRWGYDSYNQRGVRGHDSGSRRETDDTMRERDERTVFLSQLSQRVTEKDVFNLFSRAGRIRDIRLVMDRRTGRHKGHGYVEFYRPQAVPHGLELDGADVCGYPIVVRGMGRAESRTGRMDRLANVGRRENNTESTDLKRKPTRLVDVTELARLLNPRGLPLVAVSADGLPLASTPPTLRGEIDSAVNVDVSTLEPRALPVGNPGSKPVQNPATVTAGRASERGVQSLKCTNITLPESEQVPLPIPGKAVLPAIIKPPAMKANNADEFTRLYVGSVPFSVSEDDLSAIFKPFGELSSVQIQREVSTGRSKGYGFVEFSRHDAAKKALELNGLELAGRSLKVNLASSMTRGAPAQSSPLSHSAVALQGSVPPSTQVPLPGPSGMSAPGAAPLALSNDFTGELDDGRDSGVAMNVSQRVALMQRLSRGTDMGSGPAVPVQSTATRCVVLHNLFDPVQEARTNPSFDIEVAEDVRDEVTERYGSVKHLHVQKTAPGNVFLFFNDVSLAEATQKGLDGRWFGGRKVNSAFITEDVYREQVPNTPAK